MALKKNPITIKKMVKGTYISIITLNVNGLNTPTKRHRLAEWIQKQEKKQTTQLKRRTEKLNRHFSKNTYRWPTGT